MALDRDGKELNTCLSAVHLIFFGRQQCVSVLKVDQQYTQGRVFVTAVCGAPVSADAQTYRKGGP